MVTFQPTTTFEHAALPAPSWNRRLAARLLGLRLFTKVLVANCAIVLVGVGVGTWFTLHFVQGPEGGVQWAAVALLLLVGFSASVLINAAIINLALQPLRALEHTVDRVAGGDFSARTLPVLFPDPDVQRLADTLNDMLSVVQGYRAQLQKLSEQVLAAQEDERKRIARELHDETAQSLTTLLIRLKMLERARDSDDLQTQIQDLRELTVETLEAVRQLAVDLRPATLDDLGLLAALDSYTEVYAARLPVEVDFSAVGFHEGEGERLPSQVELVLYRVVQEALTNVAKHADAARVLVRLERREGAVLATVEDDGFGFDVPSIMRSRERGLGLFGMQERLALVQGQLSIDSAPGRGTRVEARVPLTGAAAQLGAYAGERA